MKWRKTRPSSRRKPGSIQQFAQALQWIPAFAGMTLLLFCTTSVHAQEPYTYAPEGCEFRVQLPEEPYTSQKCNPEDPQKCQNVSSYTQMYGFEASVNFNITCEPVSEDMYSRYTGEVMEYTLAALAKNNRLDDYNTGFQDLDYAKHAVIMGTGTSGSSEKMYVSQLWIGRKSIFTIEGEVIGTANMEADALFADVMKSVRHESAKITGELPEDGQESKENQDEEEDSETED